MRQRSRGNGEAVGKEIRYLKKPFFRRRIPPRTGGGKKKRKGKREEGGGEIWGPGGTCPFRPDFLYQLGPGERKKKGGKKRREEEEGIGEEGENGEVGPPSNNSYEGIPKCIMF